MFADNFADIAFAETQSKDGFSGSIDLREDHLIGIIDELSQHEIEKLLHRVGRNACGRASSIRMPQRICAKRADPRSGSQTANPAAMRRAISRKAWATGLCGSTATIGAP